MKNPKQLWKDLSFRYASQSTCKSRWVGAIVVIDDRVVAEGWNSPPGEAKVEDCPRDRCQGKIDCASGSSLDQAICVHAEVNAISSCLQSGIPTRGASLYCTTYPCVECAKLIVTAKIKYVGYFQHYNSPLSDLIFKKAGVETENLE